MTNLANGVETVVRPEWLPARVHGGGESGGRARAPRRPADAARRPVSEREALSAARGTGDPRVERSSSLCIAERGQAAQRGNGGNANRHVPQCQ